MGRSAAGSTPLLSRPATPNFSVNAGGSWAAERRQKGGSGGRQFFFFFSFFISFSFLVFREEDEEGEEGADIGCERFFNMAREPRPRR
jgi:hypothetical protein